VDRLVRHTWDGEAVNVVPIYHCQTALMEPAAARCSDREVGNSPELGEEGFIGFNVGETGRLVRVYALVWLG